MIKIIGPRDQMEPGTVNTTSHSRGGWSRELSPFTLGPIHLYGSHTSQLFENAWQFAKLYPEYADKNGQPTNEYWTWAKNGWNSRTPFRYPVGKGRKPLCSLWNGRSLGYIQARKQIYIPLYQDAVKQTTAYRKLEHLYHDQGYLTLFDFDGYDHHQLGMSFRDVINCQTKICGHAFVLAIMLTYGSDFHIDDLPTVDRTTHTTNPQPCYPIQIVNRKTFRGESEYIGRQMSGLSGSPLGNPYKTRPHGPFTREESVLTHYRNWLWQQMQDKKGPARLELIRLTQIAKTHRLILSCWCAPELCHGSIVKNAIEYLIKTEQ